MGLMGGVGRGRCRSAGIDARRRLLATSLAALVGGGVATSVAAHTPYRQWQVYRRKHLLIGCHKDAPATYALAKRVVAVLEEHLPEARSRVARGPSAGRLASLLGTEQMDVAVLDGETAAAMAAGRERFAPYGPIALRLLARLPGHCLAARAALPERHAWLVARALDGAFDLPERDGADALPLPWHPGASAWRDGAAMPESDGESSASPPR